VEIDAISPEAAERVRLKIVLVGSMTTNASIVQVDRNRFGALTIWPSTNPSRASKPFENAISSSWSAGQWRTSNPRSDQPGRDIRHRVRQSGGATGDSDTRRGREFGDVDGRHCSLGAGVPHFAVDVIGEPGLSAPARPALNSDAYGLWLDDVMGALSLARASFIGVSLGGWLALDYATRRPERVASLVAMCPGGVGRQKIGIALKIIPLRLLGRWGKHKAREMVLGRAPAGLSPGAQCFMEFLSLIYENFRPRWVKMPVFSDEYLRRLTMPVLAILGGNAAGFRRDKTAT
jgi:pimeloyl-ACP methyl ester carboxylesterase